MSSFDTAAYDVDAHDVDAYDFEASATGAYDEDSFDTEAYDVDAHLFDGESTPPPGPSTPMAVSDRYLLYRRKIFH